jgi:putative component of membrane protein insertase Oxa1/YidC/SpoIIIJ protein YidD
MKFLFFITTISLKECTAVKGYRYDGLLNGMKIFFVLIVMLWNVADCKAQSHFHLAQIVQITIGPSKDTLLGLSSASSLMANKKTILYPLFYCYKNFISSQDSQRCSFTPTCSVYALKAIHKRGIFWGILDGFDRLTRCNGAGHDQYEYIQATNELIDEVD